MFRPILPNPLIPTLVATPPPFWFPSDDLTEALSNDGAVSHRVVEEWMGQPRGDARPAPPEPPRGLRWNQPRTEECRGRPLLPAALRQVRGLWPLGAVQAGERTRVRDAPPFARRDEVAVKLEELRGFFD